MSADRRVQSTKAKVCQRERDGLKASHPEQVRRRQGGKVSKRERFSNAVRCTPGGVRGG